MINQANWVTSSITDIPEPSTLAIFALGALGLACRRIKKQA
ncbi:PEP-CTERM sorting domain-containing protein [Thalassotalea fusca]